MWLKDRIQALNQAPHIPFNRSLPENQISQLITTGWNMASLAELPVDIIYHICKELDADDFLALRRLSKQCNEVFKDLHLSSLYKTRVLYLIPVGLENLFKIATHPSGMNKLVQNIEIRVQAPYYKLWELQGTLQAFSKHKNWKKIFVLLKHIVDTGDESEFDVDYIIRFKYQTAILTGAFAKFPNLQKITVVEAGGFPGRSERHYLNLLYPRFGFAPGTRVPLWVDEFLRWKSTSSDRADAEPDDEEEEEGNGQYVVPSVLDALVFGTTSITALQDYALQTPISYFNMHLPQLRNHQTSFSRLKTLFISLNLEGCGWAKSPYSPVEKYGNPFFTWLNAIGESLETIDLCYETETDWPYRPERDRWDEGYAPPDSLSPPVLRLPRIRNLTLRSVYLVLEPFIETIRNIGGTLEVLDIRYCVLQSTASDLFHILNGLNQHNSGKLKRFDYIAAPGVEKYRWGATEADNRDRPTVPIGTAGDDSNLQEQNNRVLTMPGLEVRGDWKSSSTMCNVTYFDYLLSTTIPHDWVVNSLHLPDALDRFKLDDTAEFWKYVSRGHWLDEILPDSGGSLFGASRSSRNHDVWGDRPRLRIHSQVPPVLPTQESHDSTDHQDPGDLDAITGDWEGGSMVQSNRRDGIDDTEGDNSNGSTSGLSAPTGPKVDSGQESSKVFDAGGLGEGGGDGTEDDALDCFSDLGDVDDDDFLDRLEAQIRRVGDLKVDFAEEI